MSVYAKLSFVSLFLVLLVAQGCTKKKIPTQAVTSDANLQDATKQKLIAYINKSVEFPYSWAKLRGRATITSPDNSATVSLVLKMRRDSIIWGSANLILEIGRLLITPDSAMVLNTIQREYYNIPSNKLSLYGLNQIPITDIQHLLLGVTPHAISDKFVITQTEKELICKTTSPTYRETIVLDKNTSRLIHYELMQSESKFIQIDYSDYMDFSEKSFPTKIKITENGIQNSEIDLEISNIALQEFDEVNFRIPKGYKKEDN